MLLGQNNKATTTKMKAKTKSSIFTNEAELLVEDVGIDVIDAFEGLLVGLVGALVGTFVGTSVGEKNSRVLR